MKGQRYRFRLIALLLAGLLVLAGMYGFQTIPMTDTGGSLRDAILRLTGRTTPMPSSVSSASPSVESSTPAPSTDSSPPVESTSGFLTNGLGRIVQPQSSGGLPSPSPEPTSDVSSPAETTTSSLTGVIQQVLFPQASDSAVSPVPELTPDETNPAETTPAPPLSEILSNFFGTETP